MTQYTSSKHVNPSLRDNLNHLMKEAHITMSQLHRNTDVPIPTIQRMRNDYDANPTISSLKPIADFFNITVSQLIGDEPLPHRLIVGGYRENRQQWITIPLISWEEAITWPKATGGKKDRRTISTDIELSKQAYALQVEEENWINLAPETLLIIEPKLDYKHRDFVVVYKKGDNQATLKQLLVDDGIKYLKPLVVGYQITQLTNKHKLLGAVMEYKMELKR
jgi:SOS-response transcriptional repressor LexA